MPAKKKSTRRRYSQGASKTVASAMRRKKRGTLKSLLRVRRRLAMLRLMAKALLYKSAIFSAETTAWRPNGVDIVQLLLRLASKQNT